MKIGLIDADLLDKGTNFPNLALMKLSSYYKDCILLFSYTEINKYHTVFISKVFDYTKIPDISTLGTKIIKGGTGFYFDNSPPLPYKIEHSKPDYNLYSSNLGKYYKDYSIGFTTRGCFRKCKFCVNRNSEKVRKWSNPEEFIDESRKKICLLDDNIFGYKNWKSIFKKLQVVKKPFQYKQGLDIRLLTEEKAEYLINSKYDGDYIFAFDNYDEKELIIKKLELWAKYWKHKKRTKFYVLCAFKSQTIEDIIELFERIKILFDFGCFPYIMRFKDYKSSKFESIYTSIAGWCNQPHLLTKMTFEEYTILKGMGNYYKKYRDNWNKYIEAGYKPYKCWRELNKFKKEYPKVFKKYKNLKLDI